MDIKTVAVEGKAAHRTVRRSVALLLVFTLLFVYLGVRLFCLQIFGYEEYQKKVMDQITVETPLRAGRGQILDANGRVLAADRTVYRIYISPKNIATREKREGGNLGERIARGLSEILGISYDTLLKKTQKTRYLDETVARNVTEEVTARVLTFVRENGLEGLVLTEAGVGRYYPAGTLAAHVLGFTGSDNQGLFGLELYYNDDLAGKDGTYLSAVDAHGDDRSYGYTTYTKPTNGLNLVTTLDSYIQRELEGELMRIVEEFDVKNRVTGIVMNVNTGAILGMATAPTFDPNAPYELDALSSALLSQVTAPVESEEYKTKKQSILYEMWRNKAVTELYEPGSTFKIVTAAMAIDKGATTPTDTTFFCGGSYAPVKGVNISCWRRIGHGRGFSFAYGLQQSCNCAMMQVASRIGSEDFYRYFCAFGMKEKTGIDLPGEADSIFHTPEGLKTVELATSSFGQRFKVTPLQELTAIAAVANGGYLVTPHLIDKLTDEEGNTIYQQQTLVKRQAVSTDAAMAVCSILEEGVSGTGASRNAYAAGYRIAAKTGTSEKLDKPDSNGNFSLRIGSCVGFAPYDNAEIAAIIVVDEPTTAHFGSAVAAPGISSLMSKILPYLGYDPVYREGEQATEEVTLAQYVGMTVKDATDAIRKLGLTADVGNAAPEAIVTAQFPAVGSVLNAGLGRVLLTTDTPPPPDATVPDVIGLSLLEATRVLLDAGLNIRVDGTQNTAEGGKIYPKAAAQSVPAGTPLKYGSSVTVRFLYDDKE